MQTVTTIGLDIAKSVFGALRCVDGQVVIRRQLKRRYVLAFFQKIPPCLVGIEACASSHHWSRELQTLGHTVRLMPPAYVKPGYEASAVYGVGAPRNTPAEIVDKLNKEINAGLADTRMQARLADLGGTALRGSPADFAKLIADETEKWAKVIKFAGIEPE
jgi:transposase